MLLLKVCQKKLFKIGKCIVGTLSFGKSYIIAFENDKPSVIINPNTTFGLRYKEVFTVSNNIRAITKQYVLAIDKCRRVVADGKSEEIIYAFSFI